MPRLRLPNQRNACKKGCEMTRFAAWLDTSRAPLPLPCDYENKLILSERGAMTLVTGVGNARAYSLNQSFRWLWCKGRISPAVLLSTVNQVLEKKLSILLHLVYCVSCCWIRATPCPLPFQLHNIHIAVHIDGYSTDLGWLISHSTV